MPKTYNVIMFVLLLGGVVCAILADTTATFASGLVLLVVGTAGLSSGYVTHLDDEVK
ncbi:hypothetical protein [Arthrobacter sp. Alg241-R88]|uniref:hypothetical protein n=1 Tax=Arthrobacter sp. Alg241-R88 TaxID=2305984 RepID=UPI0013D55BE6|nr:hypothetical protein [Arthrobacter sp. Alg241-R88]